MPVTPPRSAGNSHRSPTARTAATGQRNQPARAASGRERGAQIRAWAKDQGIAVSDRGRIPAAVIER
jgi:hypothetical protein